MSNLVAGFNAQAVEPISNFDPIPAGWYTVIITDSEEKPTKSGAGSYLQMRLDVVDGEYQNRVLFERLNLNNPNPTAVEIAQRTLSAICHAVGVLQPQDSSDLHNIPLLAKVAIQPARDGYEASNIIKGYKAAGGTAPVQTAAPAASPAPDANAPKVAPAPAGSKKPWE